MKKVLTVIITFFVLLLNIKASNKIYYYDNEIYVYDLENLECEFEYKDKLDYIQISKDNSNNLLISKEEIEEKELDVNNIIIRSRCLVNDEYSEWVEDKITVFDYEEIPVPEIDELNIGDEVNFKIKNKEETEKFFDIYSRIFSQNINYITEYSLNDGEWTEKLEEYDKQDVKLSIRIRYQIGEYTSNYSNVLEYEKHPEKNACLFGNDFCCKKILDLSICIWLLSIFIILILTFILIDKKRKKEREA